MKEYAHDKFKSHEYKYRISDEKFEENKHFLVTFLEIFHVNTNSI